MGSSNVEFLSLPWGFWISYAPPLDFTLQIFSEIDQCWVAASCLAYDLAPHLFWHHVPPPKGWLSHSRGRSALGSCSISACWTLSELTLLFPIFLKAGTNKQKPTIDSFCFTRKSFEDMLVLLFSLFQFCMEISDTPRGLKWNGENTIWFSVGWP